MTVRLREHHNGEPHYFEQGWAGRERVDAAPNETSLSRAAHPYLIASTQASLSTLLILAMSQPDDARTATDPYSAEFIRGDATAVLERVESESDLSIDV